MSDPLNVPKDKALEILQSNIEKVVHDLITQFEDRTKYKVDTVSCYAARKGGRHNTQANVNLLGGNI